MFSSIKIPSPALASFDTPARPKPKKKQHLLRTYRKDIFVGRITWKNPTHERRQFHPIPQYNKCIYTNWCGGHRYKLVVLILSCVRDFIVAFLFHIYLMSSFFQTKIRAPISSDRSAGKCKDWFIFISILYTCSMGMGGWVQVCQGQNNTCEVNICVFMGGWGWWKQIKHTHTQYLSSTARCSIYFIYLCVYVHAMEWSIGEGAPVPPD